MLRSLLMLFPLFFSPIVYGEECKINAEAVIGVLEFEVKGCDIKGELRERDKTLSGNFSVDLTKLDTGVNLRNEHMRDKYLETDKYPKASLELLPVKYGAKTFKANLNLHGKTKPISGDVVYAIPGKLKVKFTINITDFGIDKPGYKGIVIGEKVNILVSLP